jgi:PKD repeat protein
LADAGFGYTYASNYYFFTANSLDNTTYSWNFGNGQSSNMPSPNVTYTQSGVYTITLIVTDACGGADTSTQTIAVSLGLAPTLFQQQVSLSPNPATDFALLTFENDAKYPYTLSISDVHGRVIQTLSNITENKISVSTTHMASGTYFWELKGKETAKGILLIE